MRIALVQCSASIDVEANLRKAADAVEAAAKKGARVVCFPEVAFARFFPQHRAHGDVRELAEPIPGPITDLFRGLARMHEVVIIPNLYERDGARCFDTSPVIDADGSLLGRTRMVHITEYERFHEQGYYAPGDTGAPVYATKAGRIGVAICYDRHFPEYMRALALGGAELVVVPQAGTVGEWPDGGVVARAGRKEQILTANIDLGATAKSHAKRLFLKHRRPDVYGAIARPSSS